MIKKIFALWKKIKQITSKKKTLDTISSLGYSNIVEQSAKITKQEIKEIEDHWQEYWTS